MQLSGEEVLSVNQFSKVSSKRSNRLIVNLGLMVLGVRRYSGKM